MIITNSNVEMVSSRQYSETSKTEERLNFWQGERPNNEGGAALQVNALALPLDSLAISPEATAIKKQESIWEIPEHEEIKLRALIAMLEALTGKKISFKFPVIKDEKGQEALDKVRNENTPNSMPRAGWGLEYDFSHTYFESESVSFESNGRVMTADGREINFGISMNMSRSFYSHEEFSLRLGAAANPIDPLVINFNTNMASLTQDKVAFDLDNDGQLDMISFVNSGSGFLALDLNEDGLINNGSELFGPTTGNGFRELAEYDTDGNNWIDENDPIFNKLRIWTKDENGQDVLFALGEVGIGAIFLGSADTAFTFKDANNTAQGQLQSTGVFLKENGSAGIIQQIDLFA